MRGHVWLSGCGWSTPDLKYNLSTFHSLPSLPALAPANLTFLSPSCSGIQLHQSAIIPLHFVSRTDHYVEFFFVNLFTVKSSPEGKLFEGQNLICEHNQMSSVSQERP